MKHKFRYEEYSPEEVYVEYVEHHGYVMCQRCYDSWCDLCEPDRLKEPCGGSSYEMVGQFDILTDDVIE